MRKALPDLSTIAHSQIRALAPPNSKVWKNNSSGAWIARFGDQPTISRSWQRYSEGAALRLVLQHLWRAHCESEGLPLEEVPFSGLF